MTLLELFLSVVDLVVGMFSQVVFGLGYIIVAFLSSIGKVAAYFVAVVPALSIVVGIVPTPVWVVFDFILFGSVLAAFITRQWGA